MDKLSPFLQYQLVGVNTRYTLTAEKTQICYFIRSGAVSMYRQPDDILIDLFDAPTLRGAISLPPDTTPVYVLKTILPSEIAIIEREKLFELLTEHNLWEDFSRHQLAMASMVIERIFKLTTPSTYNVVRHQLYELINLPEDVRESILAENYIRSKTRRSRSGIMRILSDLKERGYIVISKGILKEVHNLPENI
ncbi:helix-turn-helix domain-containing protein [Enterobacter cloacae complex sp. ECC445]|uniref:helix-turn-helix domain-containing protein n=1 Tax=Enterobacter cloacae complex sp. ECC445 TaxID=2913213 RepID=UPI001F2AE70E|nr:helix-turn-helix domain-containing protein [Enterobacter cloacae complex sp. ECC445]MCG0457703.1 helix-turn-helix domain-containing protein [Enterobacter cloacae complex sp. ECC445]